MTPATGSLRAPLSPELIHCKPDAQTLRLPAMPILSTAHRQKAAVCHSCYASMIGLHTGCAVFP